MRSSVARKLFVALPLLLWAASPALANPIDPRPGPVNWTKTWIDFIPGAAPSIMFMSESEEYQLTNEIQFPSVTVENTDDGAFIDITIPNFVDPLPRKKVLITFVGGNPEPDLPDVLEISAFDTPFPGGGLPVEVFGTLHKVLDPFNDDEGFHYSEWWQIRPNPDWETIRTFVPTTFELFSIHIFTTSKNDPPTVPEPSALAMGVAGLVGLAAAGRRRR